MEGNSADLRSVVDGSDVASGIPGGDLLTAFAEAALGDNAEAIKNARDAVAQELGHEAMVDAAGVIANFQRMVRIADSTGIPLDEPVLMMTRQLRGDLGINEFSGAQHNPDLTLRQRIISTVMGPLMPMMLKRMAKRRRAGQQ